MNDDNLAVIEMLNEITKDKKFMDFRYSKEFILRWISFCNSIDYNIQYHTLNENENDQAYLYEISIGNHKFLFRFSIRFIDRIYKQNSNIAYEIVFNNIDNELYYDNYKCYYTTIPKNKIESSDKYSNLNQVYVIPFPQKEYMFVIIDGNHRVCSQIRERKLHIKALYIDYIFAAKSLATPLQMCAYFINEDYWKIRYNLGKLHDYDLWKSTNIVNYKVYLKNIPLKCNYFFL